MFKMLDVDRQTANLWSTIFMIANYSMAMILLGILYGQKFGIHGITTDGAWILMMGNIVAVFTMYRWRRRRGF